MSNWVNGYVKKADETVDRRLHKEMLLIMREYYPWVYYLRSLSLRMSFVDDGLKLDKEL